LLQTVGRDQDHLALFAYEAVVLRGIQSLGARPRILSQGAPDRIVDAAIAPAHAHGEVPSTHGGRVQHEFRLINGAGALFRAEFGIGVDVIALNRSTWIVAVACGEQQQECEELQEFHERGVSSVNAGNAKR